MTALVTMHVWRLPRAAIPRALWTMAVDRAHLRAQPGVDFAKLLGTGSGSEFGPAAADLTRWAAFTVWNRSTDAGTAYDLVTAGTGFAAAATSQCTLALRPIATRGTWAGVTPFTAVPARPGPGRAIAVLTRARLRTSRVLTFWRSIDPVAATLGDQPGLLAAFGIGEAPLGFQGTLSVWRAAEDITRFAYRQPEHAAVVARTPRERWYAEELFARFEVLDITGDREVIGWRADP